MSASPLAQTVRAPSRAASAGASRAHGIMAAAMGRMQTADTSADRSRTNCRYCRTMKMKPKKAKNCAKIDMLPAARAR